MIDYIKLLNENNLNLGIITIVLGIIFVLAFILVICYIFTVPEEIMDIIILLFVFVLLGGFQYARSEIDAKENLAKVAKYNVKSLKNLDRNIEIIKEKNPYLEESEINKILNEFYKPKEPNAKHSEILKELKN